MLRLTASFLLAGLVAATSAFAADPPVKDGAAPAKDGVAPLMTSTQAINHYIAEGWEKAGIKKPAAKATDLEFHRRVFLDLIGRIPTALEVLAFEQDKATDKRAKLVRRLLYGAMNEKGVEIPYKVAINGKMQVVVPEANKPYTEEYSDHWADMWTVWLMSRTTHPTYREQMQSWLAVQFSKNIPHNELVKLLIGASGATNQNSAVNFVLHHLGEKPTLGTDPGYMDAVPITSRITRLFTGLQTQCTQCHDHPFNKEWIQSDFWGTNAFFRQTRRSANPTPRPGTGNNNMMVFAQVTLSDDDGVNKESRVFFERRDGKLMSSKPTFLKDYAQADRGEFSTKKLPGDMAGKTRRQLLAEYVVQHDNFAKAYVNRMWGHLFGRGLNKEPTIDDFGSHNEVVHPELMEKLAGDFAKYGYDSKALLEAICTSDVYGLSHVANKDYADEKYNPYFARMPLKALSPEVLHKSLVQATKSADEVIDKKVGRNNLENWLEKLVRNFGDDEGNELTFNGTVVQALLMMNGSELNSAIKKKGSNVVDGIMARHKKLQGRALSHAVIDDLFITTVNRHATPKELAALTDVQDGIIVPKRDEPPKTGAIPSTGTVPTAGPAKPPAKPPVGTKPMGKVPGEVIFGTAATDPIFYQDVFWALMNTTEFMLNH